MFTTCSFVAHQPCRRTSGRFQPRIKPLVVGHHRRSHPQVIMHSLLRGATADWRRRTGTDLKRKKFKFSVLFLSVVTHTRMEESKMSVGTLSEEVLNKLSKMLDNSSCGWRQLANAVSDQPKFRCRWETLKTARVWSSGALNNVQATPFSRSARLTWTFMLFNKICVGFLYDKHNTVHSCNPLRLTSTDTAPLNFLPAARVSWPASHSRCWALQAAQDARSWLG